jgi:hypothetical protein
LALLQVVHKDSSAYTWIKGWKYAAVTLLAINLVSFLADQIQTAIYPQLEQPGINFSRRDMFFEMGRAAYNVGPLSSASPETSVAKPQSGQFFMPPGQKSGGVKFKSGNLMNNPKSQIQTGPAQPDWTWNRVNCYWDGPVTADQSFQPILLSPTQHRIVIVVRVALLLLLTAILLGKRFRVPHPRRAITGLVLLPIALASSFAQAQEFPDSNMLKELRDRMMKTSDAFPRAAEIPVASLKIDGNRVVMSAEIHAAVQVAVPLPGKLPVWSPMSVIVNGKPTDLVRRKGDYLWTVLPAGVHQVVVESILPDVSEWEWSYLLQPRTVSIEAPGWTITGLRKNGVPDQQVYFLRQQQVEGTAAYDRSDFNPILAVERHIEAGLIWQVHNQVTRLSNSDRAVSVRIPLLVGEKVLTANVNVENGSVEARMGASENSFSWTSELPTGPEIKLVAPESDQWVERWYLTTSPVWNVSLSGLSPVFESNQENLVPVWRPWPNEAVTMSFSVPSAVVGDTATVQNVTYKTELGNRQRTMTLNLDVECSIGGDFLLELDDKAEISSIYVDGQPYPARRVGKGLIVPLHPGRLSIGCSWRTNEKLKAITTTQRVTLPVDAANITSVVQVPESRWVLWADGPTLGPAIRLWVILLVAILAGLLLGRLKYSPLGRLEWVLLAIGLTQVDVVAALVVVAWLFLLGSRGKSDSELPSRWQFNLRQILIIILTIVSLAILIVAVGSGLLGQPRMFVVGNGSSQAYLSWFQPHATGQLPEPMIVSVSVWYYRLLMLAWALWLACALVRWLNEGWTSFSRGGIWKRRPRVEIVDAALATASPANGGSDAEP